MELAQDLVDRSAYLETVVIIYQDALVAQSRRSGYCQTVPAFSSVEARFIGSKAIYIHYSPGSSHSAEF